MSLRDDWNAFNAGDRVMVVIIGILLSVVVVAWCVGMWEDPT